MTPSRNVSSPTGFYQHYNYADGSSIYCKTGWVHYSPYNTDRKQCTAAWKINGKIRERWASMNWEQSCLGFPVKDEYGTSYGARSEFEHGFIDWYSRTGETTAVCRG
jgi:LGFP repeat